jgi:hypothetical protein
MMNYLIMFFQACDIIICDFMQAMKVCQEELARKFINGAMTFYKSDFQQYSDLTSMRCEDILLEWKELPGGSGICHLMFNP